MCDELPSSLVDVDNGLAEIDWMMGRLRIQRRRLRTQHNAALPISRLPVEILVNIFLEVAFGAALSSIEFTTQAQPDVRLLRLTHVCSYWRDLAIETPSLWTTPPFEYPQLAELYLPRSSNQPLNIIFHPNSLAPPSSRRAMANNVLTTALSSHWNNIRNITLRNLTPADAGILQALTSAALQLQTLIIELDDQAFERIYFFEQQFLANHAPLLRTLSLKRCIVPVDWLPLASLVRLELEATENSEDGVDLGHILAMLERTPALEHLSLKTVLNPDSSTQNISLPRGRVPLPRLRQLTFYEEEILTTLILLTQLRLPEGLHTCISAGGVHPVPRQAWIEFFAFLKDYPSVSGSPPIRALRISADEYLMQIFDETDNPGRGFRFAVYLGDAWFSWTLLLALDRLPLDNLTHLTVGRRISGYEEGLDDDVPTIEAWLAVFSSLPALQTISIEHGVAFEFVVALHTTPEALAFLHTLIFIGAELTLIDDAQDLMLQDLLVDVVRRRRRSTKVRPLQKLLFDDCLLLSSQRAIKDFSRWVDEVKIISKHEANGSNDRG
jgi:hypothetical protein